MFVLDLLNVVECELVFECFTEILFECFTEKLGNVLHFTEKL